MADEVPVYYFITSQQGAFYNLMHPTQKKIYIRIR